MGMEAVLMAEFDLDWFWFLVVISLWLFDDG